MSKPEWEGVQTWHFRNGVPETLPIVQVSTEAPEVGKPMTLRWVGEDEHHGVEFQVAPVAVFPVEPVRSIYEGVPGFEPQSVKTQLFWWLSDWLWGILGVALGFGLFLAFLFALVLVAGLVGGG